jgi:lipoyl(octanoyl) transferase
MIVKHLGQVDYLQTQQRMQAFVNASQIDTEDEIWLLEHPPVYTQGTACDAVTLTESAIPIVQSDRGGQITYHGPGQVIMYVLLNLKRQQLNVKSLVSVLEQSVIDLLDTLGVQAARKEDAPGVYVDGAKIAALGLRVKRGFSYHGLSLNIDMDLSPFKNIDPCGYAGLEVTQVKDVISPDRQNSLTKQTIAEQLLNSFQAQLPQSK